MAAWRLLDCLAVVTKMGWSSVDLVATAVLCTIRIELRWQCNGGLSGLRVNVWSKRAWYSRIEFPFRNNCNSRNYVTCSRIHMTIVNRIDRQFFSCGYSVVWRHSRLDCCPLSRLIIPLSALLVTLATDSHLAFAFAPLDVHHMVDRKWCDDVIQYQRLIYDILAS